MNEDHLDRLRRDLEAADFRLARIRALIGASADDSRLRGVFAPARHALSRHEPSPLVSLVRLCLLGDSLGAEVLDRAFASLGVEGARELGLVETVPSSPEHYRAAIALNPVALPDPSAARHGGEVEWWLLSDLDDALRRGPARSDHVMGAGRATRSLLAQAPFATYADMSDVVALDLGTGCGVVAMCLARAGARRVVATDISPRALAFAKANVLLNGLAGPIEFRQGSLFEPLAGEAFDLILANPPFVITPRDASVPVYEYRDAGLTGDELVRSVVTTAPSYLSERGSLICLANWEYRWGHSGLERVAEWVRDAERNAGPLAAWVIERDRASPAEYAETWARDGGTRPGDSRFEELVNAWLHDFEARRVTSVGLGAVRIAAVPEPQRVVREEHIGEPIATVAGDALHHSMRSGVIAEAMSDAEMLSAHWLVAEGVTEQREHRPGEASPKGIVLRVRTPFDRSVVVDSVLAGAVGACDGDLSLAQIADALTELLELDAQACTEALLSGFRELCWFGIVAPASE